MEFEALARILALEELPDLNTTRSVGSGWDDHEHRRIDLIVLEGASRSMAPLDPRSTLPHELALAHGYGHTPGLAALGVHLPSSWAGWLEAEGRAVIRPELTWNDGLIHTRERIEGECLEVRRMDDPVRYEKWRTELTDLQGQLVRARAVAVPPPGVGQGYGAGPVDTIESMHARPWQVGTSMWTEQGLQLAAPPKSAAAGERSWWGGGISAASPWQRETLAELDAVFAAEPAEITQVEVATPYSTIADRWTGVLGRTVVLGSMPPITATLEVDLERVHVDGAQCIRRRDTLATREVVREQIAIDAFDPELVEILREDTLLRIDTLDSGEWSEAEARRERMALKRSFLAPAVALPWNAIPFDEAVLAAGVFEADGSVVLITHEALLRHRISDGRFLGRRELSEELFDGFEIGAAALSHDGSLLAVRVPSGLRVMELQRGDQPPRPVASLGFKVSGELIFLPDGALAFQRREGDVMRWTLWELDTGVLRSRPGPPSFTLDDGTEAVYDMVSIGRSEVAHLTLTHPDGNERRFLQPRGMNQSGWVFYSEEVSLIGPGRVVLSAPVPPPPEREVVPVSSEGGEPVILD